MLLLLAGCGPDSETDEAVACDGITAPESPQACSFDGECSSFFVCIDGACSVPEAMRGEDAEGAVTVDGVEYPYELAMSDVSRTRGLTGRPCMADGWGLLLEWPDEGDRVITMTGMLFDLDVYWLDANNEVVGSQLGLQAGSKALYGNPEPAQRVLELAAEQ